MKVPRRQFLLLTAAAAALAVSRAAWAQSYPARPVRILAGFPPGGINDTYARLIGGWLSERLGQQFVVENQPGAGGNLAAQSVARAAPDGYTLLLTTSADAWNATLYDNLSFDIVRDFVPIATISRGPGVLVVNPSLPVNSVPELLAAAKASPGKITVASAGVGSAPYMYWELFKSMTGVDMVHVPYRGGGPAVTDLLGGQVQIYFGTFASSIEHVRAGRLRALAVTGASRAPALPDIPAMAEFLPGYDASIYVGIAAPRDTPAAIVDTLNQAISAAFRDGKITQRIAQLGDSPLLLSASDFKKLVADEAEKWRKVIRAANIRAE
ncbi:MAG: tripartite tricarboxylate transporter substrate binding protein [Xanthobacteraceae bacterium]